MGLTLHDHPMSQHGRRAKIAALELGLTVDYKAVELPVPEAYRALNPMGKVPTLDHDGFVLWESNAIMAYLAELRPEAGLYGTDARTRAEVNRWLFWESAHFGNACIHLTWERVMKPMVLKQPQQRGARRARHAELRAVWQGARRPALDARVRDRRALDCRLRDRDDPHVSRSRADGHERVPARRGMARARRSAGFVQVDPADVLSRGKLAACLSRAASSS